MNLCQEKLLIKTNTYFPNIKDKIYVTVFMEDVNSLNDNNWLTNSAVDFYIRYDYTIIYKSNINFNNYNSYTQKKNK